MWLKDETNYKKTVSKEGNSIPLLKPPIIIAEDSWSHDEYKIRFKPSSQTSVTTPLPHDEQAIFTMVDEELYLGNDGLGHVRGPLHERDCIRISMKSIDDNCSQAIGDYNTNFPVLAEYMNQIRDQLVKEFSEVVSDQIPGEIIADKSGKKEPVLKTVDHQATEESKSLPKWWPIKESTKRRWKRKYVLMEKNINFGENNISLAKKYKMDRKTVGHIIEWAKSDPDFDSY